MASAQGTSDSVMYGVGTDFQGGWGGAMAVGTSASRFAQGNTPRHRPTLPAAGGILMVMLATFLTCYVMDAATVMSWVVAAGAWLLVPVTVVWLKARRRKWDMGMAVWAKMWVCRTCGVQFQP